MKKINLFLLSTLCGVLTVLISISSYAQNNSYLVPVGGGPTDNDLMSAIVGLTKKQNPKLLIIPYASKAKEIANTIERNIAMFKKIGVTNISLLDTAKQKEGIALINSCDMIWMPGGGQVRMRKALEKAKFADEILNRYKKGNIVIGGTSAGASIMSDVMMASSKKNKIRNFLINIAA